MDKKKIFKIIVIILLIIIVLFLIRTIRNTIIISKLQNAITDYTNKNNYSFEQVSNMENGTTMTLNYYQKEQKQAMFMTNGETKTSMYNNGERIDTFTEAIDNKTVKLDSAQAIGINIESSNVLKTDNLWQTFICSILAKIKNVELNGKACYEISNFLSPYFLAGEDKTIHTIDKETGLVMKSVIDNTEKIIEYSFDNVDDSIFVEPDISEYTLQ